MLRATVWTLRALVCGTPPRPPPPPAHALHTHHRVDIVKGYSGDAKDYRVDVKGNSGDAKGYSVDVKGYSVEAQPRRASHSVGQGPTRTLLEQIDRPGCGFTLLTGGVPQHLIGSGRGCLAHHLVEEADGAGVCGGVVGPLQ
eukprot:8597872-Pyramimonas_sp.AAC.1